MEFKEEHLQKKIILIVAVVILLGFVPNSFALPIAGNTVDITLSSEESGVLVNLDDFVLPLDGDFNHFIGNIFWQSNTTEKLAYSLFGRQNGDNYYEFLFKTFVTVSFGSTLEFNDLTLTFTDFSTTISAPVLGASGPSSGTGWPAVVSPPIFTDVSLNSFSISWDVGSYNTEEDSSGYQQFFSVAGHEESTIIPEPSSLMLLAVGTLCFSAARRKNKIS